MTMHKPLQRALTDAAREPGYVRMMAGQDVIDHISQSQPSLPEHSPGHPDLNAAYGVDLVHDDAMDPDRWLIVRDTDGKVLHENSLSESGHEA